jgi:hypothetical protein
VMEAVRRTARTGSAGRPFRRAAVRGRSGLALTASSVRPRAVAVASARSTWTIVPCAAPRFTEPGRDACPRRRLRDVPRLANGPRTRPRPSPPGRAQRRRRTAASRPTDPRTARRLRAAASSAKAVGRRPRRRCTTAFSRPGVAVGDPRSILARREPPRSVSPGAANAEVGGSRGPTQAPRGAARARVPSDARSAPSSRTPLAAFERLLAGGSRAKPGAIRARLQRRGRRRELRAPATLALVDGPDRSIQRRGPA